MNYFNLFRMFVFNFSCLIFQLPLFADTYDFGVIGDAGLWNTNTQNVHDSLMRNQVQKLVMPGDNVYADPVYYPTYEAVWDRWRTDGFSFDIVAIGNHNNGYPEEIKYFNMPAEAYAVAYNQDIEFVVLNSDNESTARTQAKFLEQILATTTSPFVFIVYHHPTYTLSVFHHSSEKAAFQKAIRPILTKYRNKITALLVGHDHLSLVAHFNDLPVILSGSAHEQRPHIPLNYIEGNVKIKTNWYNNKAALWAHLSVDTDLNYAKIDFVRGSDDQTLCTVQLLTGLSATLMKNCL